MYRFPYSTSSDRPGFRSRLGPKELQADDLDGLAALHAKHLAEATALAGRPLTDREARDGIARGLKPDAPTRIRRKNELTPPVVDERTPAQVRDDLAQARLQRDRENAMSQTERAAVAAHRDRVADDKRREDEARREAIRQSPAGKKLRADLDALLFRAAFDPAMSDEFAGELQHQSDVYDRHLDAVTVSANVRSLKAGERAKLEPAKLALKTSRDAIAAREKLLKDSPFDDVQIEMIGRAEYLSVAKGGQTIKISRDRYDSTDHELLATQLFGETPHE